MSARRHRAARPPRGFVLLAVLWVLAGLASLSLLLMLAGRDTVGAARNRVNLARAHWAAEGCVEIARAVAADALGTPKQADGAWRALDDLITSSTMVSGAGCAVSIHAAGSTLDVNAADAGELRRLFLAMGVLPAGADSLVNALLDWRDPDDEPRTLGAERAWYSSEHRFVPRNGPIADARELMRIRGFDRVVGIDSVLGAEPGRVVLGRAPVAVLASLPGFTGEAVDRVAELRARGALPTDLLSVAGALSPDARDSLAAHYAEVVPLVTIDPDAWIVTAHARDGDPPVEATVEVRLVRAGARPAVVRHRSWP